MADETVTVDKTVNVQATILGVKEKFLRNPSDEVVRTLKESFHDKSECIPFLILFTSN